MKLSISFHFFRSLQFYHIQYTLFLITLSYFQKCSTFITLIKEVSSKEKITVKYVYIYIYSHWLKLVLGSGHLSLRLVCSYVFVST